MKHNAKGITIYLSVIFLLSLPHPVSAQEPQDPISQARVLQQAGEYAEAITTLELHLQANPGDAGALWLLGQTLYWAGKFDRALTTYQRAVRHDSDNHVLRLDYANLLMEQGHFADAEREFNTVISLGSQEEALQARALLGRLAYWKGDLNRANQIFDEVLVRAPDHPVAVSDLAEIRFLTAPQFSASTELWDDSQPFTRYRVGAKGSFYPSPLWALKAGMDYHVLDTKLENLQYGTSTEYSPWAGTNLYVPSAKSSFATRAGAIITPSSSENVFTGRAEVSLHLPEDARLTAAASRERYRWTPFATDSLIMYNTFTASAGRVVSDGLMWEASVGTNFFVDDNLILTAFAWLLVPVGESLHLGYGYSFQDSKESRWVMDNQTLPSTPGELEGHYEPYYTPEMTHVHNLLGKLSLSVGPGDLHLNGSYGVYATEQVPTIQSDPGGVGRPPFPGPDSDPVLVMGHRQFNPFTLEGTVLFPLSTKWVLRANIEHSETAFYTLNRAAIGLDVKLRK